MVSSRLNALTALIFVCLGLTSATHAQNIVKAPNAGQHISAALTWPQHIPSGKPFSLMLTLEIEKGFHVQANTAKDPNIPTTVQVVAPKGFKVGKPVFPAAKKLQVGKQTEDV